MERFCAELGLPENVLVHTHNSAATVRLTAQRHAMVRVGAACYGVRTSRDFENPAELKPVMSFRTWVAQLRDVPKGRTVGYGGLFTTARDSKIASLPVGFGEGYPRALFNKGIVLIHGKRCPVIGRVSLNVLTIDVTDLDSEVRLGDEVVLIGSQGGRGDHLRRDGRQVLERAHRDQSYGWQLQHDFLRLSPKSTHPGRIKLTAPLISQPQFLVLRHRQP